MHLVLGKLLNALSPSLYLCAKLVCMLLILSSFSVGTALIQSADPLIAHALSLAWSFIGAFCLILAI